MAALLERFYDPTSGAIMLDGLDIRTLDLAWLRGQVIGYINQVETVHYSCSFRILTSVLRFHCRFNLLFKGASFVWIFHHGEHSLREA